jgi:hypothetical protein
MTPAPALHQLAEGPKAPVHFAGTAFKGDQSSGKPRHAQQAAPGHDARMSEIAHQFQGALALIIRTFGCGVRRGYRPLRGLASSLWVSFLLADDAAEVRKRMKLTTCKPGVVLPNLSVRCAHAVPSFERRAGLYCKVCRGNSPQPTALGRTSS